MILKREPKKEGKKGKVVTVTVEKKRLQRVVKAKPMSRKHMSDALNAPQVTQKDIEITEQIIERFGTPRASKPAAGSTQMFKCFECGTMMPVGADECPKCRIRYLKGLDERLIEELMMAEQLPDLKSEECIDKTQAPVVHLDTESGIMNFLNHDEGGPDIMFECSQCGTMIGLNVDECPMCGAKLELADAGLVGVFADMVFDDDPMEDIDCPFCGEHVALEDGMCPSCGETILARVEDESISRVNPVLKAENVVFLHLDIEAGELNYVQKAFKRVSYDHMSVQLEGIGTTDFDRNWSSLSRI